MQMMWNRSCVIAFRLPFADTLLRWLRLNSHKSYITTQRYVAMASSAAIAVFVSGIVTYTISDITISVVTYQ